MQIWLTIFASCPQPAGPRRLVNLAYAESSVRTESNASKSPPAITVSVPFCAPVCPPETGASTKPIPRARAAAASSRANSADVVVWSTKIEPRAMVEKAPA